MWTLTASTFLLVATVGLGCAPSGITLLILCGGETEKCVDVPDSGCVPVNLCFLPDLEYPPLVSLNNGTFVAFSSVTQFEYKNRSASAANVCIKQEAFKNGTLEIRIKDSGTTSNPVTLHENPGSQQHCLVMPEVYNSDIVLVNITVDSNQPCFQAANTSCSITATSGNGWTPQPVSYPLGHSSYNFTGFKRCLNYSSRCCILHEGYSPAVCEAGIEEFMRPLPPNILKAEIMPSAGGLHLTVTLEAQKYFCSKAGKFVAEVLTESNSTVATSKEAEVKEKKRTQVLSYMFSPGVSVQQGNPLTVVVTVVDDDNSQNYRNSTSSSREIQWVINTPTGWLPWLSLIAIAFVGAFGIAAAAVIKIACKFCKCPANPQRSVAEQHQNQPSDTVTDQAQGMKFVTKIKETDTVVIDGFIMRSRKERVVSRSEEVEREKGMLKSALSVEQLFVHSVEPPTSADQKKKPISSVQASETGTTSGPCYTVPELPPAANKEVKL